MDVSVIVPTYNERDNIADLVAAIGSALEGYEHEIVVVDDGSPDGTADAARELRGDFPVRVIERDEKQGLGAAYKHAFGEVDGDVVVQMDADFSHPPEVVPDLVAAIEDGNDVAVGSRYVEGGDRNDPLHRRIFPLIGSYLYRVLLRSPVQDVTSGFKAYDSDVVGTLTEADLPDGFHYQAASLFRLLDGGASVVEVPIDFRPRRAGTPKYTTRDLVDNASLLARLTFRKNRRVLAFGTVGASGVAIDMGLLYLLTEFIGLYYLFSAIISAETATITNFVLNDLWTFRGDGESGTRPWLGRMARYHVVAGLGIGIKLLFLWLFTDVMGIYYLVSNLIAIGLAFVWNYVVNVLWTWKQEI